MEKLELYSKLKPLSIPERESYAKLYLSSCTEPKMILEAFTNLMDVLVVLTQEEKNLTVEKHFLANDSNITESNATNEARIIPLFPTNTDIKF